MIRYLLDRDVMSELDKPDIARHPNVRTWLGSMPDDSLFVSALTIMEGWKGFSRLRKRWADRPDRLADCDRYEATFRVIIAAFRDRVVAVDDAVAECWGQMLGQQDKHRIDAGLAASAIVRDMVIVTRNVTDFQGRAVRVLDPFRRQPIIVVA